MCGSCLAVVDCGCPAVAQRVGGNCSSCGGEGEGLLQVLLSTKGCSSAADGALTKGWWGYLTGRCSHSVGGRALWCMMMGVLVFAIQSAQPAVLVLPLEVHNGGCCHGTWGPAFHCSALAPAYYASSRMLPMLLGQTAQGPACAQL